MASQAVALAADISVMEAYTRASATRASDSASVYMVIMNHSDASDRLVTLSSDVATAASLHQSQMTGDVARMLPVPELVIAAHSGVTLAPGSYHIMLTGLKHALVEGDNITVVLGFARAGNLQVVVPVKGVAALPHQH